MSIIVRKSTIVRPAEDTPRKILWLSRLDMIYNPYTHSRALFMYRPSESLSPFLLATFFNADILKKSLSKTLVPFYPFAGRLQMNDKNGRYEIDCNGEGALFVEAETPLTMDKFEFEFESDSDFDDLRKLMVPQCDYSKGLSSFPLLMAQLTRFKCGGVCLSIVNHHHAHDGASAAHFNSTWARLTAGLDIAFMPVHDRLAYLGPRNPPQIKFHHSEFQPPLPPLRPKDLSGKVCDAVECVFKLSNDDIYALKQQAALCKETPDTHKLSTFEILAGHVWRCATRARGLADDQDVNLCIPVNGRSRLKEPTLPRGYFGNVLIYPTCTLKAKDVTDKSLGHVASRVHEMMERVNDWEYLRSAIDYIESQLNLGPYVRNADTVTCPNLSINSWAKISVDEVNFGWGKPRLIRHGGVKFEGQSFFVPSGDGDGSLSLAIKLFTPHMPLFQRYFYITGDRRVKETELRVSRL